MGELLITDGSRPAIPTGFNNQLFSLQGICNRWVGSGEQQGWSVCDCRGGGPSDHRERRRFGRDRVPIISVTGDGKHSSIEKTGSKSSRGDGERSQLVRELSR